MNRTERFEQVLAHTMERVTGSRLLEAMNYSLLGGGKRIRPQLLYAVLAGYGIGPEAGDAYACAIEMIHTYSLIHDDLPAMDNDDLRRGKPTSHKQFDEATAILAGDGLLTYAFETCTHGNASPEQTVRIIGILSQSAGVDGMVLGQVYDTLESGETGWEELRRIHELKTGRMFAAPLMIAAVLAGQGSDVQQAWYDLGITLGLAFQLQDDLLDVRKTAEELGKTNSDIRNDKTTGVTLLGEKGAEDLMHALYRSCEEMAESFEGFDPQELIELIRSTGVRNL